MAKNWVSHTSIKDSAGNILTDENKILARWREYFENLLKAVKVSTRDKQKVIHLGKEEVFIGAEVVTAIKGIKSGKAAGEDEIRPRCWKRWLKRNSPVKASVPSRVEIWQNFERLQIRRAIILKFKKEDRKLCTNYKGIPLVSLPRKVYAKCLERKCQKMMEWKLESGQCSFRPSRSTTDQTFTLKQIFKKSWKYDKDLIISYRQYTESYNHSQTFDQQSKTYCFGIDVRLLFLVRIARFTGMNMSVER